MMGMNNDIFSAGRELLRRPVLPLASMVQFLYMTGPFATVAEVIDELPEPIETGQALYPQPRSLLREYLPVLGALEKVKAGTFTLPGIVDVENNPVDPFTAGTALIQQELLTAELERINSVLCAPCGCTLCCVGPEPSMAQEYFEIPLTLPELDLFPINRCDSEISRQQQPQDEEELYWEGKPFYHVATPTLFHWKSGWSLILPRNASCPNLNDKGQCRVYSDRPIVCRRPQIFPYVVEQLEAREGEEPVLRIRQSLLAVIDCPYVRELQDELSQYAAASELDLILKQNKQ